MNRSHTMISMRDGALRLAVPTAEYAKMVHQAEQEVSFEESICGPMSYSQRHSRVEALIEFAVWKHIWKNHPYESSEHAPMLTRSWRNSNQSMDCSAQAPRHLPSTTPPRMGELQYDGRRETVDHSSNSARNLFPPSQPQARHHYPHAEQHHGLPISHQPLPFPRSGVPYPQVPNTPGYRPSNRFGELFPTRSPLPPIGTGRSSPNYEVEDPFSARDVVSITSRPLQQSGTYTNPFTMVVDPYLKKNDRQQQPVRGAANDGVDMQSQRRASTSGPRPDFPPSQTFARELPQNKVPFHSGSPTRRGSVSFRRSSQAEPQDRRNKVGDISSPHGIFKKRRDSSPRKAAVAARAAIAHSARKEVKLESEEVSPKTSKPSWAQVAAGQIKEEPTEDNIALQAAPQQASVPIKEEKVEQKEGQTWAQIAAAKWMEKQSKQEYLRRDSFGKPHPKFGQLKLIAKDYGAKVEVKEEGKEDFYHGPSAIRAKPKSVQFEKAPRKDRRSRGRGMRWACSLNATM